MSILRASVQASHPLIEVKVWTVYLWCPVCCVWSSLSLIKRKDTPHELQIYNLSIEIEIKVLNDLTEKMHGLAERDLVRDPEVAEIVDKRMVNQFSKMAAVVTEL